LRLAGVQMAVSDEALEHLASAHYHWMRALALSQKTEPHRIKTAISPENRSETDQLQPV